MNLLSFSKLYLDAKKKLSAQEKYGIDKLELEIKYNKSKPGHHREHIRDDIYTYRANLDIRLAARLWKPNEYLLLYCGHHDDVYDKIRRLDLAKVQGCELPVPKIVDVPLFTPPRPMPVAHNNSLAKFSDAELRALGLTNDKIADLRKVDGNDNAFSDAIEQFSNAMLGETVLDLYLGNIDMAGARQRIADAKTQKRRSITDILKTNPTDRENYFVLDERNAKLMEAFNNGTLENWQVFLHPEQLKAVTMYSDGPMMVKGPAGTGKTVVLVHRAKWLLENVFTSNERILITTFNKSLEYTIAQMLKSICTPQQIKRLDVVYFDQWLKKAWKKAGGEKILYRDAVGDVRQNLFLLKLEQARRNGLVNVDRTNEFIEREYDYVVQEYKLRDEAAYLAAVRPRKFGMLRHGERHKLWQIFQNVNGDPFDPNRKPASSSTRMRVINHVTKAIEAHELGIAGEYAAVLVDESQDMGAAEYRLFGALTGNVAGHEKPNSLLFAGDGHQRIYGRMGSLISCGINVRGGRTVILKKCYRSSKALKRYAERLLDGFLITDMDDVQETLDGSEALDDGVAPVELFGFGEGFDAMHDATADKIKEWMVVGSKRLSDYAVLLREGNYGHNKTWKLGRTAAALSMRGLKAVVVSGRDKYDETDAIKVMTMHRAKGMQFYGVVINLDGWPHKPDDDADEAARNQTEEDEKKLLYMAIMRAVRFVMLTGVKGKPSQLEKASSESKAQTTGNIGEGKKDDGASKPKKLAGSQQDGQGRAPVTPAKPTTPQSADIYEQFIAYLKSKRKSWNVALQYRRDISELKSSDKDKVKLALSCSKLHGAALATDWADFAKQSAVAITLEEAARKSAV